MPATPLPPPIRRRFPPLSGAAPDLPATLHNGGGPRLKAGCQELNVIAQVSSFPPRLTFYLWLTFLKHNSWLKHPGKAFPYFISDLMD